MAQSALRHAAAATPSSEKEIKPRLGKNEYRHAKPLIENVKARKGTIISETAHKKEKYVENNVQEVVLETTPVNKTTPEKASS